MLGFATIAPLVSLLLVALVQMASIVWTREIVAEKLRESVANAARRGGSSSSAYAEFSDTLSDLRIPIRHVQWSEVPLAGESMYEVTVEIVPPGITLIPGISTSVSASAVIE